MHPEEFHWQVDARTQEHQRRKPGLSEDEALQMKDELRHLRVKAGAPPE